jgi:phosphohistidine phosphatase
MKTLFILRHAKSSWTDPDLADFDRPLNERGESDAPFMGRVMAQRGLVPDLILSSPAARAKRTAELAKEAALFECPLLFDDRIYEASPQTLRAVAAGVDDKVERLMIVGHNPGMEGFVKFLTGRAESMSTASIAVIELDIDRWSEIDAGSGSLTDVLRPKEIQNRAAI